MDLGKHMIFYFQMECKEESDGELDMEGDGDEGDEETAYDTETSRTQTNTSPKTEVKFDLFHSPPNQ